MAATMSPNSRAVALSGRIVAVLAACFAFAWALSDLLGGSGEADPSAVAAAIIRGERFRPQALEGYASRFDRLLLYCDERRLRNLLVIRAQLVDAAFDQNDMELANRSLTSLDDHARDLLACSPRQGFAWLALYWTETNRDGANDKAASYLRHSYAFAPHEGWIAIRRNRLAVLRFRGLAADLQERALLEFVDLLGSKFVTETAGTFKAASPAVRNLLLPRLAATPTELRKRFSQRLLELGITAEVPGVVTKPERPWT